MGRGGREVEGGSCCISPHQGFSGLCTDQNPLEGRLISGPTPRVSDSVVDMGWG